MKTFIVSTIFLILTIPGISQSKGDSKIIVTVSDTTNLYERVKLRLIKGDFIIKETGNRDTIVTYPRELKTVSGYAVFRAVLNNNQVTFSGSYNLKKSDYFGYEKPSRDSKPIIYYKGSKTWRFLHNVAESIGSDLSYQKKRFCLRAVIHAVAGVGRWSVC